MFIHSGTYAQSQFINKNAPLQKVHDG